MAKSGFIGSSIQLIGTFTENGILFNPYSIQDVKIYDQAIGGTLLTTITPNQLNTGTYEAIWNIPNTISPGIYYEEWSWDATSVSGTNTQRHSFVLESLIVKPSLKERIGSDRCTEGYWGRNINKRIESELIPFKIKSLLASKITSLGKDVFLWQQVIETTPLSLICSCVKNTTDRADITCNSCYGTKYIPGYNKFAHETIYLSSISSGLTFFNTSLNTDIKPHRILLIDGFLSGTITSSAISYDNSAGFDWDFKLDVATIKTTNTILVEFSIDNIIFYPISQINDTAKKPIGSGFIYIKITLSRNNVNDRSPEFEIIRIRHANNSEPFIKILRPQVIEFPSLMQYGRRFENLAERFWTMPLDYFDINIDTNTPDARILEDAFYQRIDGINKDTRFVITKLFYNEELSIFTHQSFETRKAQDEEVYAALVF